MSTRPPSRPWSQPTVLSVAIFAALIFMGQLVDALWTAHVVGSGQAVELNPLMAWAIARGLGVFLAIKLGVAVASVALLAYGSRRFRWVWLATRMVASLMVLLVCFHAASGLLFMSGLMTAGLWPNGAASPSDDDRRRSG